MTSDKDAPELSPPCPDFTLSVCMLASGSKGNATYVTDGSTSILIDAGLSGIEIQRRLDTKGLCPENLNAIIVSHEHSDHIQGVGVLSRRFNIPVYISHKTKKASPQLGSIADLRYFECGTAFNINHLFLHPFSISHDAIDPAGFTVEKNETKIGIATDLGVSTLMVKQHLKECTLLILEANHDPDMLINGPYPWPLKQRIKSRTGHLSNHDSATLLKELLHDRLRHVVLAHLSEINNTPEKALSTVGSALNNCKTRLDVATQDKCTKLLYLK
ncbi:MAG: MBL fold metallo-hydrolase [Thermodesulfobacteriota bacterium]|nr:MBL fold metallo-hydrolase [Thermodesulfobacteriota bacterium]